MSENRAPCLRYFERFFAVHVWTLAAFRFDAILNAVRQETASTRILQLMAGSSDALPYAVVVAAALALFVPASFAW